MLNMNKYIGIFLIVILFSVFCCNFAFGFATPYLEFEKSVDKTAVVWGDEVTYTYTVENTSTKYTTFCDVTVIDDNATPDDSADDFIVGKVDIMRPGDVAVFTVTKILTPLCAEMKHKESICPGSLNVEVLPNGNVQFTYTQSRSIVDNTYGVNAVGYKHKFKQLYRSDNAEFSLTNADGQEVMYLIVDYLEPSKDYPSGYGTSGVFGKNGSIPLGNPEHVLYVTTSLTENLNQSPDYYNYTVDSPPEPDYYWDYFSRYTVIVDGAAFGEGGFGAVNVVTQHNSPAKNDEEVIHPEPCERLITNSATVTAYNSYGELIWEASDDANVWVTLNEQMYNLSGTIYFDMNANDMSYNENDNYPINGVSVELRKLDGTLVAATKSTCAIEENEKYIGNYIFNGIPSGEYQVNVFNPAKLDRVTATLYTFTSNQKLVELNDHVTGVDFGYCLNM